MHIVFLVGAFGLLLQAQPQPPFKGDTEYKIEMEYSIKPRPVISGSNINLEETEGDKRRRASGGDPLPYLIIYFSFLELSDQEVKFRCTDDLGKTRLSRKAELNKKYKLEIGFTDDVKDRVTPHEFTILLVSGDKKETSRISLSIDEDGTFLVNGMKRGKF